MELVMHHLGKKKAGKVAVSDAVFAQDFNEPLVHQVLVAYMAGSRAGTKAQKNRSDVSGGGKKPWKQKGLGRARVGSIRSPLWRSGGTTFAARPRDFSKKVNRKMYRGAIRSILSELARQERLTCIDSFELDQPRTRSALEALGKLGLKEVLIVTGEVSENVYLATRNVRGVEVINSAEINPYSLVGYPQVLMTKDAVEKVEAWLS